MRFFSVPVVLILIRAALSTPSLSGNGQKAGTFGNPAADVRPKFRYWLPDASIDPAGIAADIKSIGSIGAGGIELCNYYMYGGQVGAGITDWSLYGFGTPAYNKILHAAAQASIDNGLVMDLGLGPESGQGVPAEWDNVGLAHELVSYNIQIPPGGTYEGKIPGYGNGTLVSVTTAAILDSKFYSILSNPTGFNPGYENYTVSNISADSINDITRQVRRDGSISLKVPVNETVQGYFLWASYFKLSSARAVIPGQNPQSFLQNGSFAVDHFSSRGAKVTTDFLEKYVLVDGVKELMQKVGKYMWEDSVEIHTNTYWTPNLAKAFNKMHGYDIGKYAMLLAVDNGVGFGAVFPDRVYTDAEDRGQGYVSDYRATMGCLLAEYYEHLVKWSETYLGMEFSGQVGYNLPVDMLEAIPVVSAPEDESLGFGGSIDNYRQYVGPSNMAGKKVISNEMGAASIKAYQQHLPTLLTLIKQAYSGGNNQMVMHGATYSYQYPNTTWPGFTTFGYLFAEQHSRHQPAWENGYEETMNFIARNNHVLQTGTPKRDIVFWSKQTRQKGFSNPRYAYEDLIKAGYGYEYISPSNFKLPLSVVKNQVLAPEGPAYKLLVLRSTDILTTEGVDALVKYAKKGFPIMLSGGLPSSIASAKGLDKAKARLDSITSLPNVHTVAAGPLAAAIASIGIQPRTAVSSNQLWYSYWRELNHNGEAYIYVYNDGNSSEGSIKFASTKVPYFFDCWTGEQIPVVQYSVDQNHTTIPLSLAPKQSIVIAFLSSTGKRPIHVTSGISSVLGYTQTKSTALTAKVPFSASDLTISTSNGKENKISAKHIPKQSTLQNWTLVAEKWGPSADFYEYAVGSSKSNATYKLTSLISWPLIQGLKNTSGVGYYSTSFVWTNTSLGATIDFGRVVHTLRVDINGHRLPALDVTHAIADISKYLVKGRNKVVATVSTPMINGMRPYLDRIKTSGSGPLVGSSSFAQTEVEAGLVQEVVLTPYEAITVKS